MSNLRLDRIRTPPIRLRGNLNVQHTEPTRHGRPEHATESSLASGACHRRSRRRDRREGSDGACPDPRSAEPSRIRLSPEHTRRFTDRLARMRGAVMKMGQLMSMDGSDIFTPEAAEIMSALRERAEPMPMSQLAGVLEREYGRAGARSSSGSSSRPWPPPRSGRCTEPRRATGVGLRSRSSFRAFARASTATSTTSPSWREPWAWPRGRGPDALSGGRAPPAPSGGGLWRGGGFARGVWGGCRRGSGLFRPARASRPLDEPRPGDGFRRGRPGRPLSRQRYSCAERDRAATALTRLSMRELFEFGLVQSDPNFGNYLYDATAGASSCSISARRSPCRRS
jgi:aarF domain-containing kinase